MRKRAKRKKYPGYSLLELELRCALQDQERGEEMANKHPKWHPKGSLQEQGIGGESEEVPIREREQFTTEEDKEKRSHEVVEDRDVPLVKDVVKQEHLPKEKKR